jgi:hypothetical protein
MVIYKTTNLANGKIYIGQDSKNDKNYLGSGKTLFKAIKKYGKENFKKEILEECLSKKQLDEREKFWILKLNSTDPKIGYNISPGGTGGKLVNTEWKKGKTYEEAYGIEKAKLIKEIFSKKRKGKKRNYVNFTKEEVKKKIANTKLLNPKKMSEETKNKVSLGLKEFFKTENGKKQIEKTSKAKVGIKQTEESNKKRSEALKGKRPKVLDVHPSARYWFFYDENNNLILETLGKVVESTKLLGTNQRHIKKFNSIEECMSYKFAKGDKFKAYWKKYYKK